MTQPLTAAGFTTAIAKLRAQPRYTAEQIVRGAARKLSASEVDQLHAIASVMPDLSAMLNDWTRSDRPLTDHDMSVMRQARQLWEQFSNGVYQRVVERSL